MRIVCPHCQRDVEFSGDPPRFCAYCGQPISADQLSATAPYSTQLLEGAPGPSNDLIAQTPKRIGNYRLLRTLGTGGMGTVYEAEEDNSGRRVAVKLIASSFATSPVTLERFRQEGRLASLINHPCCVFVLAADEQAGQPYIVMELMPGSTLKDLVEQHGPLAPEDAIRKILDVIEGLQEAHRQGVLHRDVKPSNCFLLADGRVKIGDFGLSKALSSDANLTQSGAFVGTPLYAAPEQIKGEPLDFATDVYAVAATLYFLLTGKAPFQQGSATAVLARIVSEPPPPIRTIRPDLSPALEKVILRGLERERERRWRNLAEFRAALLDLIPGQQSIGGLSLRVGAYLIDGLLFLPLLVIADVWLATISPLLSEIAVLVPMVAYFTVLEGLWGASLGKHWLRLRVWQMASTDPPGLARTLLRTALFFLLIRLPGGVVGWVPGTDLSFWGYPLQVVGVLLLASTMRARTGYRAVHDLLSGTRVVQLPWPDSQPRSRVGRDYLSYLLTRPDGLPTQVGPFVVRGAIRWDPSEQILLAEDPTLGRRVGLWLRPHTAPPLNPTRRDLHRPTRLRWLTGGLEGDQRWDAFVAPDGCPLTELLAKGEPLLWSEFRAILQQLCEELAEACDDHTLPPQLTAEQVWVQSDGRTYLLDIPFSGPDQESPPDNGPPVERALAFLRHIVVFALEGRRPAPTAVPPTVRAPLPGYARTILDRLTGATQPYERLDQLRADLAQTRTRPAEITLSMRAAHLGVLALLLLMPLVLMFGATRSVWLLSDYLRPPKEVSTVISVGTERARQIPVLAWATIGGAIAFCPAMWVIWAFLSRGGMTLAMMGIALVRKDGRKATRLQCAWRALLVWAPVVALLEWSFWIDLHYPESIWWYWSIWWLALVVLLSEAALALLFPSRSLHDRLAGTFLVPE